jgi:hypothetical protein
MVMTSDHRARSVPSAWSRRATFGTLETTEVSDGRPDRDPRDIEEWAREQNRRHRGLHRRLKLPRVVNRQPNRTLSAASISRTVELLRHMMNWAVGREYLDRTPFHRGTETLIRKQHEDNQRCRRLSDDEETRLLAVATPFLRSMIIAALDTGVRQARCSRRCGSVTSAGSAS